MNRICAIFFLLINQTASLCGQESRSDQPDSLLLKSGERLAVRIDSCDARALYCNDGSVAMLGVVSEIVTGREDFAKYLAARLTTPNLSERNGRWVVQLLNYQPPPAIPRTERLFSTASLTVGVLSMRGANAELVLQSDGLLTDWFSVELTGNVGWHSTNAPKQIDYRGAQIAIGVGSHTLFGPGKFSAFVAAGSWFVTATESVSESSSTRTISTVNPVAFVDCRYLQPIPGTVLLFTLTVRGFFITREIDGQRDPVGIGAGVSLEL